MKFPRWMNLLFLAFFGYILYLGNFSSPPPKPNSASINATPNQAEKAEKTVVNASNNPAEKGFHKLGEATNFRYWKSVINPFENRIYHIEDLKQGNGPLVGCGSHVRIQLRGTLADGSSFDANHKEEAPLSFTTGQAPYPALNHVLSGMQPGGVRSARVPVLALQQAPGTRTSLATALLHITLLETSTPKPDTSQLPFTSVPMRQGVTGSPPAICGEPITLEIQPISETGHYGPKQVKNGPLNRDHFDLATTRAVEGMRVEEERLLIAPAAMRQAPSTVMTYIRRVQ